MIPPLIAGELLDVYRLSRVELWVPPKWHDTTNGGSNENNRYGHSSHQDVSYMNLPQYVGDIVPCSFPIEHETNWLSRPSSALLLPKLEGHRRNVTQLTAGHQSKCQQKDLNPSRSALVFSVVACVLTLLRNKPGAVPVACLAPRSSSWYSVVWLVFVDLDVHVVDFPEFTP